MDSTINLVALKLLCLNSFTVLIFLENIAKIILSVCALSLSHKMTTVTLRGVVSFSVGSCHLASYQEW